MGDGVFFRRGGFDAVTEAVVQIASAHRVDPQSKHGLNRIRSGYEDDIAGIGGGFERHPDSIDGGRIQADARGPGREGLGLGLYGKGVGRGRRGQNDYPSGFDPVREIQQRKDVAGAGFGCPSSPRVKCLGIEGSWV